MNFFVRDYRGASSGYQIAMDVKAMLTMHNMILILVVLILVFLVSRMLKGRSPSQAVGDAVADVKSDAQVAAAKLEGALGPA